MKRKHTLLGELFFGWLIVTLLLAIPNCAEAKEEEDYTIFFPLVGEPADEVEYHGDYSLVVHGMTYELTLYLGLDEDLGTEVYTGECNTGWERPLPARFDHIDPTPHCGHMISYLNGRLLVRQVGATDMVASVAQDENGMWFYDEITNVEQYTYDQVYALDAYVYFILGQLNGCTLPQLQILQTNWNWNGGCHE